MFIEELAMAVKVYDDTEPLRRLRDRVLAERILNLKDAGKSKPTIPDSLKEKI